MSSTRTERDSLGEMEVPADAYYGAQTERARLNFPVSGLRFSRRFIAALGAIKGEAAAVNAEMAIDSRPASLSSNSSAFNRSILFMTRMRGISA